MMPPHSAYSPHCVRPSPKSIGASLPSWLEAFNITQGHFRVEPLSTRWVASPDNHHEWIVGPKRAMIGFEIIGGKRTAPIVNFFLLGIRISDLIAPFRHCTAPINNYNLSAWALSAV